MGLSAGSRLGPYDILSPLGAGGMGEVYRAHDTTLGRDVALKILPESFVQDSDRLARFKREAQVLASLNHPNIAAIYGFEASDGVKALVLELVEGPTLADRIAQGPIPLDEALPMAKQIAEALEAAHEQGIIHRDLKPANIKVRADGTVKVLDFGLAKAFDPASSTSAGATVSPTLSLHATQAGIILGTAAYMAPEQARGKSVDKRADIWAFGCVLYEMLTGRRAFEGDDISTTLAAVIRADPEWSALPSATSLGLRRLLRQCLQKDPRRRLQAIGDARVQIEDLLAGASEDIGAPSTLRVTPWWRRIIIPAAALLLGSVVTGAFMRFAPRSTVAQPRVSRFAITPPNAAALSLTTVTRNVALTPDGSHLVYVGANGTTLFVRALNQLEATALVHGEALRDPFVSPDSEWVGFFDGPNTLKKAPITGGPAVPVAQINSAERGATWAVDGTIIFGSAGTGLQRVSAEGGAPTVLGRPDRARGEGAGCWWPEALPGGQAVLCTLNTTAGGLDSASIAVLDLSTGQLTILLQGASNAHYVASGHLVFATAGTLRAVGFDARRRLIVGTSRLVVPQARTTRTGAVDAGLADDGTLAYVSGGADTGGGSASPLTLVWVDRQGRETPLGAPPRAYTFPRVSPDGTRVALTIGGDQKPDIWLWDLPRARLTRLTLEPFAHTYPVWRPDGRNLVFSSDRAGGGVLNLFSQAADGTGAVERLTESPNSQIATDVTPDSSRLLFSEVFQKSGPDVMALRLDDTRKVLPLVQTPFSERNAIVSPDGRWLAYEANDSGRFEIYVRPFPDVTSGHWLVSTSGGRYPLWAHRGRELFYVAPDGALMGVAVAGGSPWTAGTPKKILEGGPGGYVTTAGVFSNFPRNYDIAPDDQRFLTIKATGGNAVASAPPTIVVVQHFDEELKRLMPLK
jgi:serine/threonine-protein kinase